MSDGQEGCLTPPRLKDWIENLEDMLAGNKRVELQALIDLPGTQFEDWLARTILRKDWV